MRSRLRPDVAAAVAGGRPVVALESTLIAHGLPRPDNLAVARELEAIVTAAGAVPATVGVVEGEPVVGLDPDQLTRLATQDVAKLSLRDLPVAAALRRDGATTVASTAFLAAAAGVRVFATGGLGGVHREAAATFDVSADLAILARTRILVVCAGVKSILDVAATLERLESLSVPVLGYGTNTFPGFYRRNSGHPLDWRVDTPAQVAQVVAARDELDMAAGVVVANPLPAGAELARALHDRVLAEGIAAAADASVRGKDVTPFLLDHFHRATGGASLRVNVDIVRGNARLAAEIAVALAGG